MKTVKHYSTYVRLCLCGRCDLGTRLVRVFQRGPHQCTTNTLALSFGVDTKRREVPSLECLVRFPSHCAERIKRRLYLQMSELAGTLLGMPTCSWARWTSSAWTGASGLFFLRNQSMTKRLRRKAYSLERSTPGTRQTSTPSTCPRVPSEDCSYAKYTPPSGARTFTRCSSSSSKPDRS